MEKINSRLSRTPAARKTSHIHSHKQNQLLFNKTPHFSLETIMLKQMQGQFNQTIEQCMQQVHKEIQCLQPSKVRKIIFNVERNLNKFMRQGRNAGEPLFQLGIRPSTEKNFAFTQRYPQYKIFNTHLIGQQCCISEKSRRKDNGQLRRRFLKTAKSEIRINKPFNIVLEERDRSCYQGKGKIEKMKMKTALINLR